MLPLGIFLVFFDSALNSFIEHDTPRNYFNFTSNWCCIKKNWFQAIYVDRVMTIINIECEGLIGVLSNFDKTRQKVAAKVSGQCHAIWIRGCTFKIPRE